MDIRKAFLALAVLAAVGGACAAAMPDGVRGDGTADLNVVGACGSGIRQRMILHMDGAAINGFLLTSAGGMLDGEPYDEPLGMFATHEVTLLADQFGYALSGARELGLSVSPDATFEELQADLALTYTLDGQPGVYVAGIVPVAPGDANCDGVVNVFDLASLANNWHATDATWTEADFTADAYVNIFDLAQLANCWGHGRGAAVPEPLTPLLLASGAMLLRRRRVRRA